MQSIKELRERKLLIFFYWSVRIGMGLTFIISGTRKLPGVKFTILPPTNPIGYYFDAMHQTGFYWNFIGYFQIVIGILVFFNRFVVVSSLLMMPVTVNIFLISIALKMQGTPIITSMMVLGNCFLIAWNYENYLPLIRKPFHLD
ncbi:DoxX family membrane protein [Ekhidna sp.]